MREGLGERGRSGVPRYAASRPGYFFRHAPPVEAPQMPPRPHPVRSRPRPSELSSFLSSRGRAAWSTAAARRPWTAARTGLGGRWHSWRCRPNTCTHTHTRLDLACGRGRVGVTKGKGFVARPINTGRDTGIVRINTGIVRISAARPDHSHFLFNGKDRLSRCGLGSRASVAGGQCIHETAEPPREDRREPGTEGWNTVLAFRFQFYFVRVQEFGRCNRKTALAHHRATTPVVLHKNLLYLQHLCPT